MTVLHLGRRTKFPRVSMVSANALCANFPDNEEVHKDIWSIVASRPATPVNYETLEEILKLIRKDC